MNWNHFILLLTGAYLFYYTLNIAADVLRAKKNPTVHDEQELLFFDDNSEPQLITYEEAPAAQTPEVKTPKPDELGNLPSPALEYDGALSLKDLIRAAQGNLIEFTGAIPY